MGIVDYFYKKAITSNLLNNALLHSSADKPLLSSFSNVHGQYSESVCAMDGEVVKDFKGLITCADCGCVCTPEIHKKRYVYYSCTNAKKVCKRVYVKEESLVETLSSYLDRIALSQEQIEAVTQYLKEIHESQFHTESLTSLQRERDKIQKRLSQICDDKLDGMIDEKLYLEKVREYKTRQLEIVEEMKNHEKADQNFYVTANMVLNLAARAREIFESSEVTEKRQLMNLVFQNLQLRGVNLSVQVAEPFKNDFGL
jgi:hypothetical protein